MGARLRKMSSNSKSCYHFMGTKHLTPYQIVRGRAKHLTPDIHVKSLIWNKKRK